jgi:DNA repair exonuclease SbcCD ATPase subunit
MRSSRSMSSSAGVLRGLLLASLVLLVGVAWAGDDKKAARAQMERIQRMQQAQQALEAEKGQITAEKMELETKLKSTQGDLEKARAGGRREAALRRDLDGLRAEKSALADKITAAAAAQAEQDKVVADLKTQLQAAQDELSQTRRKLASTEGSLNQRVNALATCESSNQGLYKLNTSLLEQYEKRSCSSEWFKGGPFTQLDRVNVENDRDSYKDKFDNLRVTPLPSP